jgi:hypothetical protein
VTNNSIIDFNHRGIGWWRFRQLKCRRVRRSRVFIDYSKNPVRHLSGNILQFDRPSLSRDNLGRCQIRNFEIRLRQASNGDELAGGSSIDCLPRRRLNTLACPKLPLSTATNPALELRHLGSVIWPATQARGNHLAECRWKIRRESEPAPALVQNRGRLLAERLEQGDAERPYVAGSRTAPVAGLRRVIGGRDVDTTTHTDTADGVACQLQLIPDRQEVRRLQLTLDEISIM